MFRLRHGYGHVRLPLHRPAYHMLLQVNDVAAASVLLESKLNTSNFTVMPDKSIHLYDYVENAGKVSALLPNMDIYLNADRKACIRIIQNLIFNAVTSTTNNVVIQLINIADSVQLCIKNPVASIPTEEYSKLLERFYVADVSRSNGTSGQGLYIVKKLLLMMNCTNPIIEIHDHNFMITIDFSPLLIKK